MILLQLRAGRLRVTLELIDRRRRPAKRDGNKKTAKATAIAQAVNVEVATILKR